jgi:hypothetical protein
MMSRRSRNSHEDIILCAILKTRFLVVSGTFGIPILLVAMNIDVVSFQLAEHDHAFGTLDALVRLVLTPDWGLGFPKSASGGLDIGDLAVVADHVFVTLTAAIGDPESDADTTARRALLQVRWDVEGGYSAVGSAGMQMSTKAKKGGNCLLVFGRKNDEVLESDLAGVILVRNGKGIASRI